MNTEKIVKRAVWMASVMAVVLMLGLEVTVWGDEDDDEKAEMRDFVAAVYRGQGQYNMAGSIATGEGGVIMKRGSVWLTPHGQYQKVGSVYLTPYGGVVTRAGRPSTRSATSGWILNSGQNNSHLVGSRLNIEKMVKEGSA